MHKLWWDSLEPKEKTRLGLKYRNTLAYGIFKEEVIIEMHEKETDLEKEIEEKRNLNK